MKFSNRQIFPPITPQRTVNRNHPLIDRFFPANRPISASPCLVTRFESTDNRPIFRRQSTDATDETVRNRPTPDAESSGRPFSASRHSSRQNGERTQPRTCQGVAMRSLMTRRNADAETRRTLGATKAEMMEGIGV
jgi:hypothetical protein